MGVNAQGYRIGPKDVHFNWLQVNQSLHFSFALTQCRFLNWERWAVKSRPRYKRPDEDTQHLLGKERNVKASSEECIQKITAEGT